MSADYLTHDCSQVRGPRCWRSVDPPQPAATYFDARHETMQAVTRTEGIRALCYDRQAALVESLIEPGMTVLDVGCGPSLPYDGSKAWVIGLDPSAESLAQNTDVDERIVGSATEIPLPSASVDLVVAFYAVHHLTAQTERETSLMRSHAFNEMQRVLKPGGELLVFEMSPHRWADWFQVRAWDTVKRLLGGRLDSYFYGSHQMACMAPFRHMTVQTFSCSPFATFAPIFALPWLKLPRFLYPMTPVLYRWKV